MSEPKLTVGRVETWRPIDAERVLFRAGLQDDGIRSQRAAGYVRAAMRELVRELNARLAPPAPQPEAKAEPDYTCPKCGEDTLATGTCRCGSVWQTLAAANARIAELVRERDEAYRKGVSAAKEACAKAIEVADGGGSVLSATFAALHRAARIVRETEVPGP